MAEEDGGSRGDPQPAPPPAAPARQLRRSKLAPLSIVNLLLPLAGQRGYSWKAAALQVQPCHSVADSQF